MLRKLLARLGYIHIDEAAQMVDAANAQGYELGEQAGGHQGFTQGYDLGYDEGYEARGDARHL